MRTVSVLIAVTILAAVLLAGCLSVNAPDGPYAVVKSGPGWSQSDVQGFLKRARDHGEISDAQYQKLRRQLADEYKATEKSE